MARIRQLPWDSQRDSNLGFSSWGDGLEASWTRQYGIIAFIADLCFHFSSPLVNFCLYLNGVVGREENLVELSRC